MNLKSEVSKFASRVFYVLPQQSYAWSGYSILRYAIKVINLVNEGGIDSAVTEREKQIQIALDIKKTHD